MSLVVSLVLSTLVPLSLPPPAMHPTDVRKGEKPVSIEKTERIVQSNGLYRVVETSFVFTNPNARQLSADFVFPIPEGAAVCGYSLEVQGDMIPGVVCEKGKARIAFENEQRKGVDPGIVEHIKGNVWKTRIFPLPAEGTRKANVSYIVAEEDDSDLKILERHGDYIYEGVRSKIDIQPASPTNCCKSFAKGWVLWDASLSRKGSCATDIELLKTLPSDGDWKLVVFRNVPEQPKCFSVRDELIAAINAEPCDGGTDFCALLAEIPDDGTKKLLFSDEIDTMSEKTLKLDERNDFVFASRTTPIIRRTVVTRRPVRDDDEAKEGRLLAVAWAANRIADLSSQAESRKDEFLALGREFGVISPVTSLIVLETLDQWLEHKIEPPKFLSFHDEWIKLRSAQDDPIAIKEANVAFEKELLKYWKQRVEWWNNPKPKIQTPKSGLFDRLSSAVGLNGLARVESRATHEGNRAVMSSETVADLAPEPVGIGMRNGGKSSIRDGNESKPSVNATIILSAWDPKTPYLDIIKTAPKGCEYITYIAQADKHGTSPAFYLDCAGWFFKNGFERLAKRIISNLAEFKLEDAALWRTMGWRLREAMAYDEAVAAFRHALSLRGEEGQSYRDLALVLCERGKERMSAEDISEAMRMFHLASFKNHSRRSTRRSNDIQVAVVALEELNGLIAWSDKQEWKGARPVVPEMDEAFRRDLPMDLRIIMSWDADETDIDIHVLEPNGEEAYYGHRHTTHGGFVGEDVTTGYGPEEYLRKNVDKGVYKVLSNYYASHQQALTGAAVVTATVYTNWSRKNEKREILTLRLDKPKDKHLIGDVRID